MARDATSLLGLFLFSLLRARRIESAHIVFFGSDLYYSFSISTYPVLLLPRFPTLDWDRQRWQHVETYHPRPFSQAGKVE
ncbi:hypothetical protein BDW62DRAFT_157233 [Aspergillus aurantiobrunneus]